MQAKTAAGLPGKRPPAISSDTARLSAPKPRKKEKKKLFRPLKWSMEKGKGEGGQLTECHADLEIGNAPENAIGECADGRDDAGEQEPPPGETEVGGVEAAQRQGDADAEEGQIPPVGHALAAAHELEVRVVVVADTAAVSLDDGAVRVLAVPEDGVGKGARRAGEPPEEVHGVRGRPVGQRVVVHGRLVERVLGRQDLGDLELGARHVKGVGRHGREGLGIERVGEVHERVDEPARRQGPRDLRRVGPERRVHGAQEADVVPVQREVEAATRR
jgi:hypothetical protein